MVSLQGGERARGCRVREKFAYLPQLLNSSISAAVGHPVLVNT
jgi:hypothetical protein